MNDARPALPPGTQYVEVSVSGADIKRMGERFATLIAELRAEGRSLDDVMTSMAWTLGCTLEQRGVVLDPDASIALALAPVWKGYDASRLMRSQ